MISIQWLLPSLQAHRLGSPRRHPRAPPWTTRMRRTRRGRTRRSTRRRCGPGASPPSFISPPSGAIAASFFEPDLVFAVLKEVIQRWPFEHHHQRQMVIGGLIDLQRSKPGCCRCTWATDRYDGGELERLGLAVHDLSEFFDSDAPGHVPSRQVSPLS